MDDELERFKRTINLTELAASLGYQLSPGERLVRSSVAMRHPATRDKVVIRRDLDGHWTYFSVRDDRDHGTVVDFLQRRRSLTLGAVRKELRAWLREDRPPLPVHLFRPTLGPQTGDQASVAAMYAAASPGDSAYLRRRGLHHDTLRSSRFSAAFRIDKRGNVLFPHIDLNDAARIVGYEVKNEGFTSFAAGGKKTVWMSAVRPEDDRLVIVEGAIDALSYHQLFPHPRSRYLSTGGAVGFHQLVVIAQAIAAMPAQADVVVATDNDEAGEKLGAQIEKNAPRARLRRHASPVPKDWNDYLRALERDSPSRKQHGLQR